MEEGVRRNVQQQLQLHELTLLLNLEDKRNGGSRQVFAVNPEKNDNSAPPCEDNNASSTELDAPFDEMPIWNGYEDDEDEESELVTHASLRNATPLYRSQQYKSNAVPPSESTQPLASGNLKHVPCFHCSGKI